VTPKNGGVRRGGGGVGGGGGGGVGGGVEHCTEPCGERAGQVVRRVGMGLWASLQASKRGTRVAEEKRLRPRGGRRKRKNLAEGGRGTNKLLMVGVLKK